jgi:hypothetical protein
MTADDEPLDSPPPPLEPLHSATQLFDVALGRSLGGANFSAVGNRDPLRDPTWIEVGVAGEKDCRLTVEVNDERSSEKPNDGSEVVPMPARLIRSDSDGGREHLGRRVCRRAHQVKRTAPAGPYGARLERHPDFMTAVKPRPSKLFRFEVIHRSSPFDLPVYTPFTDESSARSLERGSEFVP